MYEAFGLAGDYNQNGVVDSADYVVWRNTAGTDVSSFSGADGNGNGTIDQGDYDFWRARFGNTVAGTGAADDSQQVPEASAGVLTILAAFLLLFTSPLGRGRDGHRRAALVASG